MVEAKFVFQFSVLFVVDRLYGEFPNFKRTLVLRKKNRLNIYSSSYTDCGG